MFVGREKELTALNRLYAGDRFEFVVIYGRRRVGKTTLINQFLKEKKNIYFKRGEIRKQAKALKSSRLWTAGKQVTSE